MKKGVDKRGLIWYYSGAPYGRGRRGRGSERAGKPHGTLKIKQRDEEKEPVKDESYKVLSDEKRRKTLERKNQEIR
jgi:hypothetical protein